MGMGEGIGYVIFRENEQGGNVSFIYLIHLFLSARDNISIGL